MGQDAVQFFGWVGGWVGWVEQSDVKLISTQVVVEVEFELGKTISSHLSQDGKFCPHALFLASSILAFSFILSISDI